MRSKAELVAELRRLLHDVFVARAEGTNYPKVARNHGYVDGYMRALLDSGQATQRELLEIVAMERARVSGPATREILNETASDIVAA